MTFEFEKRTLGNGWIEVRFVTLSPKQTPDTVVTGNDARMRIAELFLSGAAGICARMGGVHGPALERAMGEFWQIIQLAYREEKARGE